MQDKILSYIEKVPALSPTIAKIIELTGDQAASAPDLIKVIKLDPTLTAKILRLINSSYFGMRQEISSINRAIVLLGFNTIKNLALSAEVLSSFNPGAGNASFNVEKFWEHSLACAVACKLLSGNLAKELKRQEEYFIAGLIHDIGKIFLIKYFAKDYFNMVSEAIDHSDLLKSEKNFFGMEHAEIGGLISEKWRLSNDLALSIRSHHKCLDNGEESPMPAIVYISNIYCKSRGFDDNIEITGGLKLADKDWGRLNMTVEQAEKILSILTDKVEEAKVFIQVGSK